VTTLIIIDKLMIAEDSVGTPYLCLASSEEEKYMLVDIDEMQSDYLQDIIEKEQFFGGSASEYVVDWVEVEGDLEGYATIRGRQPRLPFYEGLVLALTSGADIKLAPYMVEFTADIPDEIF